jgi:hypothetical protein
MAKSSPANRVGILHNKASKRLFAGYFIAHGKRKMGEHSAAFKYQGNRVLLTLPPDGFFKPVRTFWRSGAVDWKRSGHTGKPTFEDLPNVTDGMNIPSGVVVRRWDRCSVTRSFGKQASARLL